LEGVSPPTKKPYSTVHIATITKRSFLSIPTKTAINAGFATPMEDRLEELFDVLVVILNLENGTNSTAVKTSCSSMNCLARSRKRLQIKA